MLSDGQLKDATEKLRARQSVLPETDVKTLYQNAIGFEYWRTLCPEMGVMSNGILIIWKVSHCPRSNWLGRVRISKGMAIFRYQALSHLPLLPGCTSVSRRYAAQAGLCLFHSCTMNSGQYCAHLRWLIC